MIELSEETIDYYCMIMHDAYEQAAIEQGWETNPRSQVDWADVPEANKATMRVAVRALLAAVRRDYRLGVKV